MRAGGNGLLTADVLAPAMERSGEEWQVEASSVPAVSLGFDPTVSMGSSLSFKT